MPIAIRPYTVRVPEETRTDLRDRLARTRWPDEVEGAGWGYGISLGYIRGLLDYWRDGFDFRPDPHRLCWWVETRTTHGWPYEENRRCH